MVCNQIITIKYKRLIVRAATLFA